MNEITNDQSKHVYAEMNGTMFTLQNNLTNKSQRRKKFACNNFYLIKL